MATAGQGAIHLGADGVAEVDEGSEAERAITRLVTKRQSRLRRQPSKARLEIVSETKEDARKRFRWTKLAPSLGVAVGVFVLVGGGMILESLHSPQGIEWGAFWLIMGACALGLLIFGGPVLAYLFHDYRRRVRDHDGHVYTIRADDAGLSIAVDGQEVLAGPWSAITLAGLNGHRYDEGRHMVWRVEQLDLVDGKAGTARVRRHAFRKGDRILAHILLFLIVNGRLRRIARDA